jgi:hypothetical protein
VIPWNPAVGLDELIVFAAAFVAFQPAYNVLPTPLFQMFEEASTGHAGAIGRQVTVNARTTGAALFAETSARLATLEAADARGVANLRGSGMRNGARVTLSFHSNTNRYRGDGGVTLTRAALLAEAQAGTARFTFTDHLRENVGKADFAQPLIATSATGNGATGDPPLPVLTSPTAMTLAGQTVRADAIALVDGAPVAATITCQGGTFAPVYCSSNTVLVTLAATPPNGTRLLQLQNPGGPLSNELPICVGTSTNCN